MTHKRYGLRSRSLRNDCGNYLAITGLLMSTLAGMVELGSEGGMGLLKNRTMQNAAGAAGLSAAAAHDAHGNASGPAVEVQAVVAGYQFVDGGDDVVGSVPRKCRGRASVRHRSMAAVAKRHAAARKDAKNAMAGIASFYDYDTQTASGEKFDPRELTAAHRTLPFGTRLRVTDVETGQSVTVRVNDRGPYVDGRIVDLTSSAAETLGITTRGLAKVKLKVVE